MLWFDNQAEEAASFYLSVFGDGKINSVARSPEGVAFIVDFELLGEKYIGLNGGPAFKFNESISIFVSVDGQEEVDKHWNALISDGGEARRCGWLKDKFGLSWQIIPKQLGECLGNSDPAIAGHAMGAMMKMSKIVVADLYQ